MMIVKIARGHAAFAALPLTMVLVLFFASNMPSSVASGQAVLPKLRIPIYGTVIEGTVLPDQLITITVTSPVGIVKGRASTVSSNTGAYVANLASGDIKSGPYEENPLVIEPGDLIQLEEFGIGDPHVATVPAITINTASDGSSISGVAPQANRVEVFDHSRQSVAVVAAGSAGAFTVPLAGHRGPGYLVMTDTYGDQYYIGWSVPTFTLVMKTTYSLSLLGTPGSMVTISVRDENDLEVAYQSARLPPRTIGDLIHQSRYSTQLVDSTKNPVLPARNDALEINVGNDHYRLSVPVLDGVLHVRERRVTGRTIPNTEVSLFIARTNPGGAPVRILPDGAKVTSDSAGAYDLDLTSVDIAYNDQLVLQIVPLPNYTVRRYVSATGMILDLDSLTLEGSITPGISATVEVRRLSGDTVRFPIFAESNGTYEIALTDGSTPPLALAYGDEIVLVIGENGKDDETSITVPDIEFAGSLNPSIVSGRVTVGGVLGLYTSLPFRHTFADGVDFAGVGQLVPSGDGTFTVRTADLTQPARLYPGSKIRALYRLPSGHMIRRTRYVPFANVEVGGSRVCGYATPGTPVVVRVLDNTGTVRATAEAVADSYSRYELLLHDISGESYLTHPGSQVLVMAGSEELAVEVSSMVSAITGQAGPHAVALGGRAPAGRSIYLTWPVTGCFTGAFLDDPILVSANTIDYRSTNAEGLWHATVEPLRPGQGLEVALYTETGHRLFQTAVQPQARIYLYTNRVTGVAAPGADIAVTLVGPDAREKAKAVTEFDPSGHYVALLADERGELVPVLPGDTVVESGSEERRTTVEPVEVDWSDRTGLIGNTTADRPVHVEFDLSDRRMASFDRTSDSAGRFMFSPDTIPSRAMWGFSDVTAVRAIITAANGNEIAAEVRLRRGRPSEWRLLLPLILRLH